MNQEQWQELCEWAGWHKELMKGEINCYEWITPNDAHNRALPPQGMNTLWSWMVPKLITMKWSLCMTWVGSDEVYWVHFVNCHQGYYISPTVIDADPFEALSQAIYKVVNND